MNAKISLLDGVNCKRGAFNVILALSLFKLFYNSLKLFAQKICTTQFSHVKPEKPFHVFINCVTGSLNFKSYQTLDANPFPNIYTLARTIIQWFCLFTKSCCTARALSSMLMTDQGTEKVNSFQDEFLMSYSGDAQFLQFLMSDVQQLLSSHLLPLKILHILLETVVQT